MTPKDLANKLLAFYDNKPERWTKEVYARDANGVATEATQENACSWCLYGAVQVLGLDRETVPLQKALGEPFLADFNDSCTDFDEFRTKLEKVANS